MADLCTPEQLAGFLQVASVDTYSANQACDGATAAIRRYTRRHFTAATWTDERLPVTRDRDCGWVIELPQRPVDAVTAVEVNGTAVTYEVDLLLGRVAITGFLPAAAVGVSDQAVVSYTSLDAGDLADVRLIALAIAGRAYDNPRGLRSETSALDDHSETFTRAGTDDALAGVALLDAEKAMLDPYRRRVGSVRIR